ISIYIAAKKVAGTDVPVFLHGPRGIGKENVARYIHAHSNRSGRHFVHIYGNSILDGASERELFVY
ncbi:MAG: sigma 54-interacting transcriptional regulator, partial [Clostridiales bacterium]|nr:sigma 54-interacting transcriptional regulator [Clostridiales bacterium]